MKRLLLISSSRVHGSGFLEHCRDAIGDHLASVRRLLFIPFALADYDRYQTLIANALEPIDVQVESIHRHADPIAAAVNAEAIFVGGGNSFRLLKTLYDLKLIEVVKQAVQNGTPYMGSSAGTNMACPTIKTSNDMPILEPPSFNAFGFVSFQINPHFVDADPNSTHQGETREQRLAEYLEENSVPVIGLREGSWLEVEDESKCLLRGATGAVAFRKGSPPVEVAPGTDLAKLLQ